jgi:hypothetical protein
LDCEDWVAGIDFDGCLNYVHSHSGEERSILDQDPRFLPVPDSYETESHKAEVRSELGMGVYLCTSLMDEYDALNPESVRKEGD